MAIVTTLDNAKIARSDGLSAEYRLKGTGLSGGQAYLYLKRNITQSDADPQTIKAGSANGLSYISLTPTSTGVDIKITIPPSQIPAIDAGKTEVGYFFELKFVPQTGNPVSVDSGKLFFALTSIKSLT